MHEEDGQAVHVLLEDEGGLVLEDGQAVHDLLVAGVLTDQARPGCPRPTCR